MVEHDPDGRLSLRVRDHGRFAMSDSETLFPSDRRHFVGHLAQTSLHDRWTRKQKIVAVQIYSSQINFTFSSLEIELGTAMTSKGTSRKS